MVSSSKELLEAQYLCNIQHWALLNELGRFEGVLMDLLGCVGFVGFKFTPKCCTIKILEVMIIVIAWMLFCLSICKTSWLNMIASRLFSFSMISFQTFWRSPFVLRKWSLSEMSKGLCWVGNGFPAPLLHSTFHFLSLRGIGLGFLAGIGEDQFPVRKFSPFDFLK